MKKCIDCKRIKEKEEFSPDRNSCKECRRKYQREQKRNKVPLSLSGATLKNKSKEVNKYLDRLFYDPNGVIFLAIIKYAVTDLASPRDYLVNSAKRYFDSRTFEEHASLIDLDTVWLIEKLKKVGLYREGKTYNRKESRLKDMQRSKSIL